MPYGEKLKSIKKAKNLTNVKIHEICDVPLSTVTRMFDEKSLSGNFETFVALARGLNFSLDELAGLKPSTECSSELLAEKDNKISKLTEAVELLRDDNKTLRDDNKSLRDDNKKLRNGRFITIGILVLLIFTLFSYIIYDLLNGHLGIFRY